MDFRLIVLGFTRAGIAAALTLAVLGAHAADATLRRPELAETLKDNTVSGETASGTHYNLYFLQGGQVTYADAGGHHDSGTWRMSENGDVCLRWHNSTTPGEGCFHVTLDGRGMTWVNGDRKVQLVLQGAVTSRFP